MDKHLHSFSPMSLNLLMLAVLVSYGVNFWICSFLFIYFYLKKIFFSSSLKALSPRLLWGLWKLSSIAWSQDQLWSVTLSEYPVGSSRGWDPAWAHSLAWLLPCSANLIGGRAGALIPVFSFQVQVFLLQRPTASVISNFKLHLKGDTKVNVWSTFQVSPDTFLVS